MIDVVRERLVKRFSLFFVLFLFSTRGRGIDGEKIGFILWISSKRYLREKLALFYVRERNRNQIHFHLFRDAYIKEWETDVKSHDQNGVLIFFHWFSVNEREILFFFFALYRVPSIPLKFLKLPFISCLLDFVFLRRIIASVEKKNSHSNRLGDGVDL